MTSCFCSFVFFSLSLRLQCQTCASGKESLHPCFSLPCLVLLYDTLTESLCLWSGSLVSAQLLMCLKSYELKCFSAWELGSETLWLLKARLDAPCKYMVRKKVKKISKNYILELIARLSDWVQKSQRSNNGHELFLKKSLSSSFLGNFFYFMANGLRCHLGNRTMKRKLFIKECWIESMRGSRKHFKKPKPCLFYHLSWGIMFPDLWSLAFSSLRSNLLVSASKAAQRLYPDVNVFNSQLAFGKSFSWDRDVCSAWIRALNGPTGGKK